MPGGGCMGGIMGAMGAPGIIPGIIPPMWGIIPGGIIPNPGMAMGMGIMCAMGLAMPCMALGSPM